MFDKFFNWIGNHLIEMLMFALALIGCVAESVTYGRFSYGYAIAAIWILIAAVRKKS